MGGDSGASFPFSLGSHWAFSLSPYLEAILLPGLLHSFSLLFPPLFFTHTLITDKGGPGGGTLIFLDLGPWPLPPSY